MIEKHDLISSEEYDPATKELFEKIHNIVLDKFRTKGNIIEHHFINGYFIFHMGESAVMHFKMDTAPDWKFGVWLSHEKAEDDKDERVSIEIFAQNELWIDKFKPTASEFVYESWITDLENFEQSYSWILEKFTLIFDEPYLAFYRHLHYHSFDVKHVTRREAKKYYKSFVGDEKRKAKQDRRFLAAQNRFVKKYFKKRNLYYEIHDEGENVSPRYDVLVVVDPGEYDREWAEALHKDFFHAIRDFREKKKISYEFTHISPHLAFAEWENDEEYGPHSF